MWIDEKGVVHTVALPHPKTRVDRNFRKFLKANRSGIGKDFFDNLGDQTIEDLLASAASFSTESLEGEAFPVDVKIGEDVSFEAVTVEDAIERAVASLPLEWRVDALWILEDVTDSWD